MINGGRPVCSPALTGQVTIYGWSIKVGPGRARQNIDRVVDRARQAPLLRAPDFNLVL
jgi:hypothetical protein